MRSLVMLGQASPAIATRTRALRDPLGRVRVMRARVMCVCLAGVACLALFVGAATSASLVLRGTRLPERQANALLGEAMRAPGDTTRLAAGLARLVARLQDSGYLDARASARWQGDQLQVEVREGREHRFTRVQLRAYSAADSASISRALALHAGDIASPSRVAVAMDAALDAASESGHPYARVSLSGWDVDSAGVALVLTGDLGPQIAFAGARFIGARVTNPSLLERAAGNLSGPYVQSRAEAARARVEQLGLFRSVTLADPEALGDFKQARVVMNVEERPYNQFEGVLGSQGDGGLVGLARVDLENLAGTGRAARVRWESRGKGVSQSLARYHEPLVFGFPVAADLSLEAQTYDTLFTRTKLGLAARWALSGNEHLEAGLETERVVQDIADVREAASQTTRLAVLHEHFDDRLSPRRGLGVRLEASQSFSRQKLVGGLRRSVRSSAAELGGSLLRPLGARTGLSLEAHGAGRIGSERILGLYERYALGGAASLRGYNEEAFRVDRYALTRLEWRAYLPGGQYAFLFWDHAIAATRLPTLTGDRVQLLNRDGYGAGLSLAASAGRVGVTYGVASGLGPLSGKLHIQVMAPF